MQSAAKVHDIKQPTTTNVTERLQGTLPQPQGIWSKFLPHGVAQRMTTETKGVFVPYPLLAIIITLAIVLVSGLITLEVQVSNLNTTILLRDADGRADVTAVKEKLAQLEVYIHDMREKRVADRSDIDQLKDRQRR